MTGISFSSFQSPDLFRRIVAVPSLYQAWRKVRANRGVAGVDAVSLEVFAEKLEVNLRELSRSLVYDVPRNLSQYLRCKIAAEL